MPGESALRVLVLADAGRDVELTQALRALGHAPLAPVSRRTLVQRMLDDAPDGVLCRVAAPDAELFDALAQISRDCACVVFTNDASDAALERALDAGVHAWVVDGYAPQRIDAVLRLARARARRAVAAQAELARAREQLDERKWIERAKGVLMSARRIGEEEAFRLLRGASMHAQTRVADMSRAVIEAAQRADAINRAGQLRMLSQRLVKLLAQRAARVEARQAAALLAQSRERAQATLLHLRGLGDALQGAEELAAVETAWQALQPALDATPARAALADAERAADALLAAAEALTTAIEAGSGVRSVQIVNLCGRQRMRAQRIVKCVLLAQLHVGDDNATALEAEIDEFERALLELERAPLTSPDVRAAASTQGRAEMAHSSERLLDHFEALTAAYEHSLQVIMNG